MVSLGVIMVGGRRQTVAVQDVADRLIADPISQIGQGAGNPVIAPVPILLGHANDQLLDFSRDSRPARAATSFRAVELAGDQLSVPGQDGVRLSHSCDLSQCLATEAMTDLAGVSIFWPYEVPVPSVGMDDA